MLSLTIAFSKVKMRLQSRTQLLHPCLTITLPPPCLAVDMFSGNAMLTDKFQKVQVLLGENIPEYSKNEEFLKIIEPTSWYFF